MTASKSEADAELQQLEALIRQEQAYEREQYRLLLAETSLPERCQQGVSLYPLQWVQLEFGLGGRPVLILESTQQTDFSAFQSGQTVALFSLAGEHGSAKGQDRVTGVIQQSRSPRLQVYLHSSEEPEWLNDGKLGLDAYYDERTYLEMLKAIKAVRETERPRLETLREVLLGQRPARFLNDLSLPQHLRRSDFNASQLTALTRVQQAEDLALIHGPPGTGKTTTLVACVEAILEDEPRVLVCAPSNAAVDLLTLKLAEAGRKVIRLGHPARLQEAVWPQTLDAQLETHASAEVLKNLRREIVDLRRLAGRHRRRFGREEREERREQYAEARRLKREVRELEERMSQSLLAEAEVIACTLTGAASRRLSDLDFQTVIIDEAAQALEGLCWIPLLKAQRLVMAGDHCQLPPTVHDPKAQELAVTLFEKSLRRHPEAGVMLETQYRMHEQIMSFPSAYFYQGALQAAPAVAQWVLNPHLAESAAEAGLNQPLLWIDTAGCGFEEAQNPETLSYANPEEGGLLLRWLKPFLEQLLSSQNFGTEALSVGVIAPYREQVRWLKQHWEQEALGSELATVGLEIETVDSFQGQERDIICLSFVRSNERGEIGFLADIRRTNVAMTRARKKLVMVGDSATLSQHPFYRRLLDYVEAQGAWTSAWEFLY